MNIQQALREKWYSQGFNSTPLLLGTAGDCVFMKNATGITYRNFFCVYKDDYGDMGYLARDLEELGKAIEKFLSIDKNYFQKIRRIYMLDIKDSKKIFKKIDKTNLKDLSDKEIIDLLNITSVRLSASVGAAHIIEAFVLTTDIKIKQELGRYIKDSRELNSIFALLMSPIKESFVNEYEKGLIRIAKEKDKKKRHDLIGAQAKNFSWIRNSYAGKHVLTKQEIEEEAKSVKENKQADFKDIIQEKNIIIKRFNLPEKLVKNIKATEFLTTWQDERKENILTAIDYVEKILAEISRRVKVDIRYLRYAAPREISFENIRSEKFHKQLIERKQGCIYLYDLKKPIIVSGDEYKKVVAKLQQKKQIELKELTGMTASTGTAVGRVKVCSTIDSLKKVQEGDILVASMTRPEYVPAMRKAAAIITDEGGITCHAAIISRELGIPCIIGTKIATKVLKDNDLVEIKGNHGLIIILKRA